MHEAKCATSLSLKVNYQFKLDRPHKDYNIKFLDLKHVTQSQEHSKGTLFLFEDRRLQYNKTFTTPKNEFLPVVIVRKCTCYDTSLLYRIFSENLPELFSSIKIFPEKINKIAIKINLCDARTPETGAITHPKFLDAFLMFLRESFGYLSEIVVVESDSGVAMPDLFIKWFGYDKILTKWQAKYVNLSRDKIIKTKIYGRVFKEIPVPQTIYDADLFITLAKLKTNMLTKITAALKNQFGCLPIIRKARYHSKIDNAIAEINSVMRPDVSVVDGIIGMGGIYGPSFGKPIRSGIIVMSNDPVAADAFCAKFMGFNPLSIGHIRCCAQAGVGRTEYKLIINSGIKIPDKRYKFSAIEYYIFRLGLKLRSRLGRI